MMKMPPWFLSRYADVRAVVHAVVRRRVQDPLERAEPIDRLGVEPELVEQAPRLRGQDHPRRDSRAARAAPRRSAR